MMSLLSMGTLLSGCTRTFWRRQADKDSYQAITQHIGDPRWAVPRFDVTPDPRSRFFDPYDPDHAPLPPDDPAAHGYMHWVDGWQGYKGWHKFGDLMTVENPQWLANFGITEEMVDPVSGEYIAPVPELRDVTLAQAIELSQIHSREYQFQIEDVFLAALAVTYQRFQFGVRYLGVGGREPGATVNNTFVPHGPGDNTRLGTNFGVSQLLPAGTQWAVELANNTIWLFGAGTQTRTMSTLSYSIVQPLMFGAGRKVGLENLTQVERGLLYEIRDLARFRQTLFTDVVGGSSGFLNLLQQIQGIRNEYENIRRLEEQVERLLAEATQNTRSAGVDLDSFPADVAIPPEVEGRLVYRDDLKRLLWRGGPISDEQIQILRNLTPDPGFQRAVETLILTLRTEVAPLDVLRLQSQLANSINSVRSQERALQDNLDNFKILLGLPPDVSLSIHDAILKQFQLIDPRLIGLEEASKEFVRIWGSLDYDEPHPESLRQVADRLGALFHRVKSEGIDLVAVDLDRLNSAIPQRLQSLSDEADRNQFRSDLERARFLFEKARTDYDEYKERLAALRIAIDNPPANPELAATHWETIRDDMNVLRILLLQLGQNLASIQVSVRVELIEVVPFQLALQTATQIGVDNRMDLMNARARVMDARRDVEIEANRLMSTLDVVVDGDIRTINRNKPFDFRGSRSELRAGLRFTAPLDQIDERNAYRAALVAYQRERRAYMLAEDRVKLDVRRAWRQLEVLKRNLETSRRAVRLAALQYDAAVNDSNAPITNIGGAGRGGSGLQGNNLSNALNDILRAQNQLLGNWINYEQNRLNIYRDMGIMEIGPDGVWNDSIYRETEHDNHTQPPRGDLDLDSGDPDSHRAGRSRLGDGAPEVGIAGLADWLDEGDAGPEKPRAGHGGQATLFDQPVGAGVSR